MGIDANNDGTIKYHNYQDFEHKSCGFSFLQFNDDGVVFENSYYKNDGTCTLFSEMARWELIEETHYLADILEKNDQKGHFENGVSTGILQKTIL